ncbi:TRAP transporter substrate-binding protein [Acidocella facilis]|uniref:TRAP transporter substrate-binding protein n=1 Tax=Acidocella facilis TaxID=525 RepID=UPI00047DE90F|nr:TRAP transporter substrate-binding protein [Acidocella facilis]
MTKNNNALKLTRRTALAGGAALPLFGILTRRAQAAEFTYKMATGQAPSHPVNKRAQEAIDRIAKNSDGRIKIDLFPAAQLGTDAQLISQVRIGGVQFINMASSVLATYVPAAGVVNTGFAFNGYDQVWQAMDGALGKYIGQSIDKAGLTMIGRSWDNGFRQITTSTKSIKTPEDLKNFKIRVPPAPILTSLFAALGASPTPIDFSEVYTALQTHLVDGQENPLPIIATAKLYEVQKYCSLTGHVWDGYLILGNPAALNRLPAEMKAMVIHEFDQAGKDERTDIAALSKSLQADMSAKGLQFLDVDKANFRTALAKTDFYPHWKAKFGDQAWSLLESVSGTLG